MSEQCQAEVDSIDPDPDGLCDGAVYEFADPERIRPGMRVRVLVNGDFIRDFDGRGVDADHLPKWLPDRRTGDGVEGGMFESWFSVRAE
jgi:hypothetical protein